MIKKTKLFRQSIGIFLMLIAYSLQAQIGTPLNPTYGNIQSTAAGNYYDQLIGLSGATLKSKLKTIVVNANTKGQTYGDVWQVLKEADENPANTTQIWQIYVETGLAKTDQNTGGSTGWNREHLFPQTRGGFKDGTSTSSDGKDVFFSTSSSQITHAHGDAHHLRASDVAENSSRGELDFGNVSGPRTKNSSFYEPPLSAKGDIARSLFYMAVRYDALSLGTGAQSGQTIGDLNAFLQWNKLDKPDDFEMRRNNVIYTWQNNRNPFIDNPNLADYIYGDKQGIPWPGNTNASFTANIDTINFNYIASGATSTTSYTITGNNLEADISVTTDAPFELSTDNVLWQTSLTIPKADATDKQIFVKYSPTTNYLGQLKGTIKHTSTNANNLLVNLIVAENPAIIEDATTLTKDKTLDVVTWNLEYFGISEKSNPDWSAKLASVATTIYNLDADIYALQEVIVDGVNGDFLAPLVDALNAKAGSAVYTGIVGPRFSLDDQTPSSTWPAQRVCYIYRTANFTNIQSESMFDAVYPIGGSSTIPGYTGTASLFWSSGRLPFRLKADVTIDGKTETINFVNIHAKCCSDSYDRKKADALYLKSKLDETFDTDNVIVLGDYNDYYIGSMTSGKTDSPYITWFANSSQDYLRAVGASIDHISLSNELYFEHQSLTNNILIGSSNGMSDHNPILIRLKLDQENFNGQIVKLDDIPNKQLSSGPFAVHAVSSNGLPIDYEIVSGPASITGNILTVSGTGTVVVKASNPGNINTLPASDTKQFNVTNLAQTITFILPAQINLSAGSQLLLASSSAGLPVSFRITSGVGSITGNQLYFTQAGDITVEAYQDGNAVYGAVVVPKTITVIDDSPTSIEDLNKLTFSIYPNPSDGIFNINNELISADAGVKVFTTSGTFIESFKLNKSTLIDLSHLKSGAYILTIESGKKFGSEIIMIK